jgi:hypothetical protein
MILPIIQQTKNVERFCPVQHFASEINKIIYRKRDGFFHLFILPYRRSTPALGAD